MRQGACAILFFDYLYTLLCLVKKNIWVQLEMVTLMKFRVRVKKFLLNNLKVSTRRKCTSNLTKLVE